MRRRAGLRTLAALMVVALTMFVVAPASGVTAAGNSAPVSCDDPLNMAIETTVLPDDLAAWDQIGCAVAVDGDTAVVGSTFGDGNAGAAYVYERVDGEWAQTAKLTSPDAGAYEFFGSSVAVEGDTIVVGEYRDKDGAVQKGAAHVYMKSGTVWTHAAKLVASARVENGEFGYDVAISGDTIVIGSYGYDGQSGAVYVFRGGGSTWAQEEMIPPPASSTDWFGCSVDVDGDILIGGAKQDDAVAFNAGAAYVFVRSGTDWTYQDQILAGDGASSDYFGISVALDGTFALVGAQADDDLGNWSGAAYLFRRSGSDWIQVQKITPSDGAAQDEFGYDVAFDGASAIIGAESTSQLGDDTGSAYLYTFNGATLDEQFRIAAPDGAADAYFGEAVAIDGTTCVVGAYGASPILGVENTGEAYLFDSAWTTPEDTQLVVDPPGVLANDYEVEGQDFGVSDFTQPAHGRVSMFYGGAFLYWPEADFNGWDSFTYRTYDDFGAYSQYATVRILVTPVHDYVPIEGADRFETAAAAAVAGFADTGATTAVIATGRNFPDALGGSALAGALDAPLLLVDTASVPEAVESALTTLGVSHAIILGGTAAVASAVEGQLVAAMGTGSTVERIDGDDRYDTARRVADRTIAELGVLFDGAAFVATGVNFPDALAAGPIAAAAGMPIYLVNNTVADDVTIDAIADQGISYLAVLGGKAVVTDATYASLEGAVETVERHAGDNRYGTAVKVAEWGVEKVKRSWDGVGIATGEAFPDALAAGATLARFGTVLVLSRPAELPTETETSLMAARSEISDVHYFGGLAALSEAVRTEVRQIVETP